MSIAVELEELRRRIDELATDPYLLTVGADGRSHSVSVAPRWDGDELVVPAGRSSRANAVARPLVALLWPPAVRGGFSLIVDADAVEGDGGEVRLRPTRAVLHRAASPAGGNDCVTVL
jgi:hypothetical protein